MQNKYTDFGFSRVKSKDKSNLVKKIFMPDISQKKELLIARISSFFAVIGVQRAIAQVNGRTKAATVLLAPVLEF